MDSTATVLLGVIALASLVQAAVLVATLVAGARVARTTRERLDALEQEIRPQLARLGQVADGLASISDRAQRQFAEVESVIGDASVRMRRTGEVVERAVRRPAGLVAAAVVFSLAKRLLARREARA